MEGRLDLRAHSSPGVGRWISSTLGSPGDNGAYGPWVVARQSSMIAHQFAGWSKSVEVLTALSPSFARLTPLKSPKRRKEQATCQGLSGQPTAHAVPQRMAKRRPLPSPLDLRRGQGRLRSVDELQENEYPSKPHTIKTRRNKPVPRPIVQFLKVNIPSLDGLELVTVVQAVAATTCRKPVAPQRRVLGTPPLAPKLLREFLLSLVGFWVAAPLCCSDGFWVAAPSFVPPLPGAGVPTDPQSRRR